MKVLLIGFGPFPGAAVNPSAALVKALARRRRTAFAHVDFTTHLLTTAYAAVGRDLPKLLRQKPDVVLLFGVASRRRHVCIETRARNAMSTLFRDAGGYRQQRAAIAKGGPASLARQCAVHANARCAPQVVNPRHPVPRRRTVSV